MRDGKLGEMKLNTPTNLLVYEAGGGYELLDEELYECAPNHEIASSEDIVIISGTITVSP
jgi:hypothetical protein